MTVAELLQITLPRLKAAPQNASFLESVKTVQEVITRRLWMVRSELLEGDFEITTSLAEVSLDASILGLKDEQPWLVYDGQRFDLEPLPDGLKDRQPLLTTGRPQYYRLRGRTITLYPAPDRECTLKGEAYMKPTEPAMEMDVPWFGLFDQVFADTIARFGAEGLMITATPTMEMYLQQQVDMLATQRPARKITWRYPR